MMVLSVPVQLSRILLNSWLGSALPSADTLGRVMDLVDPDPAMHPARYLYEAEAEQGPSADVQRVDGVSH